MASNSRDFYRKDPALHCYPRDDSVFAAECDRVLAEGRALRLASEALLEHFKRGLKRAYPAANVHARDPLASDDDPTEVWYVYRDGTLVA